MSSAGFTVAVVLLLSRSLSRTLARHYTPTHTSSSPRTAADNRPGLAYSSRAGSLSIGPALPHHHRHRSHHHNDNDAVVVIIAAWLYGSKRRERVSLAPLSRRWWLAQCVHVFARAAAGAGGAAAASRCSSE